MNNPLSCSLPIIGQPHARFAVNKIICIGRNYAEHAREMGHDPEREPPFFFFKPQSALTESDTDFVYPWFSHDVHHELELVIAVGSAGYQLTPEHAKDFIAGFGVGLDMTCRDVQKQAKQQGRPWELAKGFDGSAPCSAIQLGSYTDLQTMGRLSLTRNGNLVQEGDWREMVWPAPELIAAVSRYVHLQAGDLIFTGTPAGVGPVLPGDKLVANLEGLGECLRVNVVAGK
jgi:fumarylpyruvate hydrolase